VTKNDKPLTENVTSPQRNVLTVHLQHNRNPNYLQVEVFKQDIQNILGGPNSRTTARSTGDSQCMSNMYSEKDFLNRCVLRRRQNVVNDSADVTSSGSSFHVCRPAIGKARLPY